MAIPPKLDAGLQWIDVARELGHDVLAAALPASILCPSCGAENLTVYQDNLGGGYWHYCFHCGTRGDLVQLCAKVWGVDVDTAARDLVVRDLMTNVAEVARMTEYLTWLNGAQQIYDFTASLADPARNVETPDVRQFRQLHNLYLAGSSQRWAAGPGRLLGVAALEEVERQLSITAAGKPMGRRRTSPDCNWSGAIVIPYYDLPGRPRSFALLGPDGRVFHRRVDMFDAIGPHNRESGLGMLPALFDAASSWDSAVVLCDDPLLAVKLQIKNAAESGRPLPLLLVRSEDKSLRHSLELLRGRRVVVWIPHRDKLSPTLTRLAASAGAQIALVGPSSSSVIDWASKVDSPADLLRRVLKAAKPWNEVLCNWVNGRRPQEVQWLLGAMDISGADLERLAHGAGDATLQSLAKVLDGYAAQRRVIYRGAVIFERDESWTFEKVRGEAELICDAVLRIDRVIHRTAPEETYYQGRIRYRGRDLEYCELRKVVEANPLEWMQQKLLDAQAGFLRYNPAWTKHIVHLATQFHPPELVKGECYSGWDASQSAFLFPKYRIHHGGSVEPSPLVVPGIAPGHQGAFEEVDSTILAWLSEQSPEATATVALAAAVAANVLAPAFNEPVRNIGLESLPLTNFGVRVAQELGCLCVSQCGTGRYGHGWPVVDDSGATSLPEVNELEKRFPAGRIRGLDETERLAQALSGRWQLLANRERLSILDRQREGLDRLIPSYLRWLCQRRMRLAGSRFQAPEWHIYVLRNMLRFLADAGCEMSLERVEPWFLDTSLDGLAVLSLQALARALDDVHERAHPSGGGIMSVPVGTLRDHPIVGPFLKDIERVLRQTKVLTSKTKGHRWGIQWHIWNTAMRERLRLLLAYDDSEGEEPEAASAR